MLRWFASLGRKKYTLIEQQDALSACRQALVISNLRYNDYKSACQRLTEAQEKGLDEQACMVYRHSVMSTKRRYDDAYEVYQEKHKHFKTMV